MLFRMIASQKIQRYLCTLVCNLLLLRRQKDRRMALEAFLFVLVELLLLPFLWLLQMVQFGVEKVLQRKTVVEWVLCFVQVK